MIFVAQKPNDAKLFDAKMAALNGFSIFGKNHFFMIDKNKKINYKGLNNFLSLHQNERFIILVTYEIFEYLYKSLI